MTLDTHHLHNEVSVPGVLQVLTLLHQPIIICKFIFGILSETWPLLELFP